MLSRVFRNRLLLTKPVQIRRFCQPDKPKIEQLYKKIKSNPELTNLYESLKNDSIKNELHELDKKTIIIVEKPNKNLNTAGKVYFSIAAIVFVFELLFGGFLDLINATAPSIFEYMIGALLWPLLPFFIIL